MIPSDLAYGDAGQGNAVPPGATLVFEVELYQVLVPPESDGSDPEEAPPANGEGLDLENSERFELPDGTVMRVPKGVKVRLVDQEDE